MHELAVDLLLGPGWLSRGIAWYGNGFGGYSHAASVIDAEHYIDSRANVIGGVKAGVQIREIKTEKCIKRERLARRTTQLEFEEWLAELRSNIGAPYGDVDIWAFITGRQEHTRGAWICSADVLRAMSKVHAVLPLSVPDHQITPNSLGLILEASGFKRWTMAPIT